MFQLSSLPLGRDKERVFLSNQKDMISVNPINPHLTSPLEKERERLFIF